MTAQIKLKHSGGNGVIIEAPANNPASDKTIALPSTESGVFATKNSANSLQNVTGINGGQLSNRNLIINGSQIIDQRNSGSAVTVSNASVTYVTDRFSLYEDTDGVISAQQSTTSPDGFTKSIKVDCTTVDTSLASSQRLVFEHRIEGNNIAHLGFGSSAAKTITLSFYVKSNLTGTFGGSIKNSDSNRVYIFSYSISSANTWERKTITIAGDTSGTWLITNGTGININWGLALGSDWVGSAGSWGTSDKHGVTGQLNLLSSTDNEWLITGVQLEVGSTATDFEHRSFGQELALCMRYYEKSFPYDTAPANNASSGSISINGCFFTDSHNNSNRGAVRFKVEKRASPSLTKYGNSQGRWYSPDTGFHANNNSANGPDPTGFYPRQQASGSVIRMQGHYAADAEL